MKDARGWLTAPIAAGAVSTAVLTLALTLGSSGAADAVLCPSIRDLGTQPGWPAGGVPVALNDRGQIVGVAGVGNAPQRSFLWSEGRITWLGTLGGKATTASAINRRGEIVGSSETAKGTRDAFLWRDGKMTDLGHRGGSSSEAGAIDDNGRIFGFVSNGSLGPKHAFMWQHGKMTDLGTLPGKTFTAHTINGRGDVVGSMMNTKGEWLAILWRHGKVTHLGSLGGGASEATAINGRGQVVGYSTTPRYASHAVLWQGDKIRDLGALPGGKESRATAINDEGQVVGWSKVSDVQRAFLWQRGRMTDLGALQRDLYSEATAIDDKGEIIGASSSSLFGTRHAVLWTQRPTAGSRCPAFKGSQAGDHVVVHENSVTVDGSIDELRADAGRAMVSVRNAGWDASLGGCIDIFVWNRARRKVATLFDHRKCNGGTLLSFGGIALAGEHAAWLRSDGGNILESSVLVTDLASGRTSKVAAEAAGGQGSYGRIVADLAGDGGLLVYRDYTRCDPEAGVNSPDVPCPPGVKDYAIVSDEIHLAIPARRLIARSDHELSVLAVGGGRVVARRSDGPLIVLAPKRASTGLVRYESFSAEHLIAAYKYSAGDVLTAATDGRTLAVLDKGKLDVIPLPGSHGVPARRSLPLVASRLADLDGKLVVYIRGDSVYVLDLTSGRGIAFARPRARPIDAQLEPDGLYVAAGRTVTFTPRALVERRLRH